MYSEMKKKNDSNSLYKDLRNFSDPISANDFDIKEPLLGANKNTKKWLIKAVIF